jgi:hypothetical protein
MTPVLVCLQKEVTELNFKENFNSFILTDGVLHVLSSEGRVLLPGYLVKY